MKRALFVIVFCFPFLLIAQSPNGISYQGVARDISGIVIQNQSLAIRTTIISNSPTGTVQYSEEHMVQTNDFGLFNINIGQGTYISGVSSTVKDIDWGGSTHFLKIEMDVSGGTNFTEMGISQIMTVPYSFYSEEAGKLRGGSSAKTMLYLE